MMTAQGRAVGAGAAAVLLLFFGLGLALPRYALFPGDMGLRTGLFECLALAALAALIGGRARVERAARWLLALCLVVFGVDHFLALAPIAGLIPTWIPWHEFWTALFGAGFIAAAAAIATGWWLRAAAGALGLMFALWVVTLHLPLALGWMHLPGRSNMPSLWSSCFIAVAMWGGAWALMDAHPRRGD